MYWITWQARYKKCKTGRQVAGKRAGPNQLLGPARGFFFASDLTVAWFPSPEMSDTAEHFTDLD
jgi:hypothetical protein